MAERLGVDYSWARPDPRELARVGYLWAYRYLSFGVGRNVGKNLTVTERDALFAAGLSVGLFWQDGKENPELLGGANAGKRHGAHARTLCAELEHPADRPVVFAIDFNAAPNQYGVCRDYLMAARDALGRPIGVYGGLPQIEAMHDLDVPAVVWMQTKAWSAGKVSPITHVYQRNGDWTVPMVDGAYDEQVAYADDVGVWHPSDRRSRRTLLAAALV